MDIGRARAFTPGWLENESIWLHMEYKYLLEILRAGLFEQFCEEFKSILIPFLDPKIYGRSPLENSSFLVSSVHPDASLHGAGFVARLSGATAEFLSIWRIMMAGVEPFTVIDGRLSLQFKPILPGWLFSSDNMISYKFLGKTVVIYHNPRRVDTFDSQLNIHSTTLSKGGKKEIEFSSGIIPQPYAEKIRDGEIGQIDVYFS